jgi:predicted alpha-1,2-mannosidase
VAGDDAGAVFSFDTQKDEIIEIVLGVSYISAENARLNVEAEMPVFAFDETRNTAKAAWNKALSRILVEGGTEEEKMKFYTAMYHTLIHPNIYNDANGEYQLPGLSAKGKISNYQRYTLFSLWDTYRTVHPFYALVFPRQASDMVKSMLDIADESGFLPRWIYGAQETGAMVGDPALPVIADTWLRGVRDFDIQRAYKAMKHNALTIGKENHVRAGMDAMLKYGYIPEDENINGVWGSVSTALEFCIADYNLALIAKTLGYENDYLLFYERAMLYRNSFDPNAGFMHPRNADGNWFTPFSTDSYTHEQGFTEGNTWNYTFMVPHDIPGLIKLMGGKRRFVAKLEECFEKGYFDVTNEPDIAYPYLFNYIKGEEWRTQKHVREIVNNNFGIGDDGLPGNDDCGTMSTWLMFSMMGFYPTCPGDMTYQLAAPVFDKITIHLDTDYYTGKTFVIETENARKENCYIKSMLLNGKPHKQFNIRHEDITKGGRLHFSADDRNRK